VDVSWPVVTLKDICKTQYGYTASASETEVGPKFLRITDIVRDQIDWDSVPYCEIDESQMENYQLHQGDIVIARTGNTTGYAKLIRDDVNAIFASYLVRLKLDRSVADPAFVGRLIESDICKTFVKSIKGGAAQGNANAKMLTLFRFRLPPLFTQHRIASTLSPYDSLIENNRHRIQLLEQSARLLYREWFVHFRFPGHEHVRMIDGVPEGWDKGTVSDFYKTTSGGTPSRKNPDFFTGDINWVKTQELQEGFIFETDEKITEDAISNSSARLFPVNTILVAMYGATIGQTAILANPAATNQACCALFPEAKQTHYIHAYLFLRENKNGLINLSQGAAQKNISQEIIKNYQMTMPSKIIMTEFIESLEPVFVQIKNLQLQNSKLKNDRDILLPRLMNGEITV